MASQGTKNNIADADSEVGCTTHLAIHWNCNMKTDKVKNYGDKKGRARKRVDLPNGKVSPNSKKLRQWHAKKRPSEQTQIVHR